MESLSSMFNVTEPGTVPWYQAVTRPFLGAAHCVSDSFPEEWPECPPAQTLVTMVVFVSVLCCCIYGLLWDVPDDWDDVLRTPVPDADVLYTRVDSRWSLDDDARTEWYTVRPATRGDNGRFGIYRVVRWPFTRRASRTPS